jgi:hypothetical protein
LRYIYSTALNLELSYISDEEKSTTKEVIHEESKADKAMLVCVDPVSRRTFGINLGSQTASAIFINDE